MGEDTIDMICRELGYDQRREREMRLATMLYERGWRTGTEARHAWIRGLSDSQLAGISTSIIIGIANDRIQKTEDTLYEKVGGPFLGGHAIDGRETPPGTVREVLEGRRQAFSEAFNEKFWSTPVGDLTLKDVNKLLPEDLREPNFGTPTKEEKPPGIV